MWENLDNNERIWIYRAGSKQMWAVDTKQRIYLEWPKVKKHNLSALKFGTQIGGVWAHLGTEFGWNTVNTRKIICDYSRKMVPICWHGMRLKIGTKVG